MPRVQGYGPRRVRPSPAPDVQRRSPSSTYASQGGPTGEAMANFGAVSTRLGVDVVERITREANQRADQVAQLTAMRGLNDLDQQVLNSPDKGILNKHGLDVDASQQAAIESWDEQADKIAQAMNTEGQALWFEAQRTARRSRLVETIGNHAMVERRKYEDTEFTAFLSSSQERAATNALNPSIVNESLRQQVDAIHQYAQRNGIGPEATEASIADARNKTWSAAISQAIESGHATAAKVYFEEARDAGQLTGEALTRMTRAVSAGVADQEGERIAGEIWTKLGPKTDTDAISIDQMEAAAREQLGDDTPTLKATIAALRTRKQAVDDGRKERLDAIAGNLALAVINGISARDVKRNALFLDASPKVQAGILDAIQDRDEQNAARAYARANRAEGYRSLEDSRKERAGWAKYYELSRPEVLSRMTEEQIAAQLPILGIRHTTELLQERRRGLRGGGDPAAVTLDDDIFNEEAGKQGLPVFKTSKTEDDKAVIGYALGAVKKAIAAEQGDATRPLSYERKVEITRQVLARKVWIDTWGRDEQQTITSVIKPKDRENAYVPIDEVDERSLNEWVNLIRSHVPALQGADRQRVISLYRERIERAHAAARLGLGPDEELRRLLGR